MGEATIAVIREQVARRALQARVMAALDRFACRACGASHPLVVSTQGDVRYVKCRFCGGTGKVVVL